jgi:hypothetical protein
MFGNNDSALMGLIDEAIREEVTAFRESLELRMVTLVREAIARSFVAAWDAAGATGQKAIGIDAGTNGNGEGGGPC